MHFVVNVWWLICLCVFYDHKWFNHISGCQPLVGDTLHFGDISLTPETLFWVFSKQANKNKTKFQPRAPLDFLAEKIAPRCTGDKRKSFVWYLAVWHLSQCQPKLMTRFPQSLSNPSTPDTYQWWATIVTIDCQTKIEPNSKLQSLITFTVCVTS